MTDLLPHDFAGRALYESPLLVIWFDGAGRLLYANKKTLESLNLADDELKKKNLTRLFADFPSEFFKGPFKTSLKKLPRHFETTAITSDDNAFTCEAHIIPLKHENQYTFVLFGHDASARKLLEGKFKEGYARFLSSWDVVKLGIVIFSPEGRFLEVNPYFRQMMGYTEEELLTRRFHDITHPDDQEKSIGKDQEILKGIIPAGWVEKRYIKKNGEEVWVISSSNLLRDDSGKPLYFVSHIQDITERKKAEETLKEVNTALKVLLDHREQEKVQLEKDMMSSLDKLVMPYLDKLKTTRLDKEQKAFVEIVISNLNEIASPFSARMTSLESRLTPTELEVADMLRHNKTTDEIADLLNVSPSAVSFHRRNIRKKLGLTNTKANLKSYLRSHS